MCQLCGVEKTGLVMYMSDYTQVDSVCSDLKPPMSIGPSSMQDGARQVQNRHPLLNMTRGYTSARTILGQFGIVNLEPQSTIKSNSNERLRSQRRDYTSETSLFSAGFETISSVDLIHLVKHQATLAGQTIRVEVLSLSSDPEKAYGLIHHELAQGNQVILHRDIFNVGSDDYYVIADAPPMPSEAQHSQAFHAEIHSFQAFSDFSDFWKATGLLAESQLLVFSR